MKKNERLFNDFIKSIFIKNQNNTFIVDSIQQKSVTYKEFLKNAINCKLKLQEIGLKEGETLCLLMYNSLDLLILYFAALLMNVCVVPIDPLKGKEQVLEILNSCDFNLLFHDVDNFNFNYDAVDVNDIKDCFYEENSFELEDLNIFDDINFNALYLITFTSGSTGKSKGVMHSFGNLISAALAFNKLFNFNSKNVFYHNLPMAYMAGILNLFVLPLASESKIILGPRFTISNIMNFWCIPIKYKVNTFWFIPTILSLLLRFDRGNVGADFYKQNKAMSCVGTAPLNYKIKKEFEDKYGISLYESYGLSETLFVSSNHPSDFINNNGVGCLLDGVNLDFDLDNEILIKVPWMFLGYYNFDKSLFFKKEYFRSGDIGFCEKGFLSINDRKKDLIIRGGVNISPRKIEDYLKKTSSFDEVAIIGVHDITLGEKTVCFFSSKVLDKEGLGLKNVNKMLLEDFGRDYFIDEFVELENIPLNVNNKVDKVFLRKIYKTE